MANYRKMRKYVKSIKEYKKERQRRRKVRELYEQGFTQAQIAEQLGISAKTVHRDLKKLKPYLTRLEFEERQKFYDELTKKLRLYPIEVQFDFLTESIIAEKKPFKQLKLLGAMVRGEHKPKSWRYDE
jgi:IS30 family transposase